MSKEIGPRERALREMREATVERNKATLPKLKAAVAVAAQKRGKLRKAKKK